MSNHQTKILVADDEPKMRELIALYLKRENFEVTAVEDGMKALAELEEKGDVFSLFMIDVMMPNMDGFALCREIRSFSDKPVIFITAKGEEYERLMGFELGADDYIVKPFSPREMTARVKAVLKRANPVQGEELIHTGQIKINVEGREVSVGGEQINLTPKEFDLLVFLINNKGKVLSREHITRKVWDYDYFGDQRTVDTHIKKLREKLGEKAGNEIKTIWGVGYKFEVN
ncbi:two component transcriptional regulator, winged helix family [Syntrophobotulus glycolicus DSM 8271]|uniref:Stage 0 sporulation protein A homolog n=1 Tax=Syntrophobotulus glycolicus (strain DSM 8271 / FlGlyR) TaxID=645991 RepID=F0SYR2_SYNGF|nr:response regulator transcription factor [Syntrophobotulus glycolicus]ADY54863.1 two component transcriptional regulator, winged helix family [Syntrophobotulus glycolicus DSM 8271]